MKLRLQPGERGSGYQFVNEIIDDAVPLEFVKPVDLGIQQATKVGVLAGHEMVDLQAVLYDGSYHAEDSNEMAFKIAASTAFKEAARKADPVVLEPVMSVTVVTQEEFMGVVIGDLNRRRGRIEGTEHYRDSVAIKALAPLAEMLGYSRDLRRSTLGRATSDLHFSHYEVAPRRGNSADGTAGVTTNNPRRPNTRSGFAAAEFEPE